MARKILIADDEPGVVKILGFDTDKDIFGFFKDFYRHYFPRLTSRVSFVRHAANLWLVKKSLFDHIAQRFKDVIAVIDSFPIPACRFARASSVSFSKVSQHMAKSLVIRPFMAFGSI
jgi:hypothetical protein